MEANEEVNFSKFYAECYDKIHATKKYAYESHRILKFLELNLDQKDIYRVLDFGCGTGIHLNSLIRQNLELFGYDRNEHMLQVAKQKYPHLSVTSDFKAVPCDMDIVYSLFDVASYQVTDVEVEIFFSSIFSKLNPYGWMVVDGWFYGGVVQDPPVTRERNFVFENAIITRRVFPSTLDNYRTTTLEISLEDKVQSKLKTSERHVMRAFESSELVRLAEKSGFCNISLQDGNDWDKDLTNESWRFVMFAKKLGA